MGQIQVITCGTGVVDAGGRPEPTPPGNGEEDALRPWVSPRADRLRKNGLSLVLGYRVILADDLRKPA